MTTEIENFPWFPEWIWGLELMTRIKKQSEAQWAKVITKTIDRVDFSENPFRLYLWEEEILARKDTGNELYVINNPVYKKYVFKAEFKK